MTSLLIKDHGILHSNILSQSTQERQVNQKVRKNCQAWKETRQRCGPPGTLTIAAARMEYFHHHGEFCWTALKWSEGGGGLVSQKKMKMLGPERVDDCWRSKIDAHCESFLIWKLQTTETEESYTLPPQGVGGIANSYTNRILLRIVEGL